jgi:outer membrane protein insertion porin family
VWQDGEPLERGDLEEVAKGALRACRANTALTSRDVEEDVARIVETGLFRSCVPIAFDTRDGIRLVFQVTILIRV